RRRGPCQSGRGGARIARLGAAAHQHPPEPWHDRCGRRGDGGAWRRPPASADRVTLLECTPDDIGLTYSSHTVVIGQHPPDFGLGGDAMLARLLMRLIADILFEAAASRNRSYEAEVDRYLEAQGFIIDREARPAVR